MEEPPQPQTHTPEQIVNADAIQNLDTARMALRWALERMHKLEEDKGAQADKAAAAERAAARAKDEYASLQKTVSLRGAETTQRELYYAKMEEFLSLHLGGKLDLAALAKREIEVQNLQELLQQKEVQLEKELQARRSALDRDFQKMRVEHEQTSRTKTRQEEQAYELKRSALEQEYLSRMAEVHEREILLKQENQAFTERQAHFEEYHSTQQAMLQTAVKNFRGEIDGQVEFRLEMSEKILAERYAGLDAAWAQEKALLLRELESWRLKSQELGPKVLELEQTVALSEEAGRLARAAVHRQTIMLEEHRRSAQAEAAALIADAAQWKEKSLLQMAELVELKQGVEAAEEKARQAEGAAQTQSARFEEARKSAELERAALAAEADSWRQRFEKAAARAQEEARGAAVLEEALAQARQACEQLAGQLEERKLGWDAEKKNLQAEADDAKARLAQARERGGEAGRDAGRAEAAHAELAAERERLEGARAEEAKALAEARGRAEEAAARALELDKELSKSREAEGAAARRLARIEEQKAAWDGEREALIGEITTSRREAGAQLDRLLELERRLAAADEALAQVRAAGERQAARFDEQRKAWEDERAYLRARAEMPPPKTPPSKPS